MELTKNIFFNTDKLVQNSKVKISYTGEFFQKNADEVSIHYGFGLNWNNINEVVMNKTELGFQAEIDLLEDDSFNFCFKTSKNEWDNNNGENFIFPLEKVENQLIVLNDEPSFLATTKRLKKSYIWSKKIRLAVYKIISYLPRLISGNYKRKLES